MAIRLSGTRIIFALAALGALAGIVEAVVSTHKEPPQAPVFDPAPNPYADGIYANGIVESEQADGSNVNLYPEVAGSVTQVLVHAGQFVKKGTPILQLDDRVQRATTAQLEAQAQAAQALLEELQAQPRPETLRIAQAQLVAAAAAARSAKDSYDKLQHAANIDINAVSRDALDTARNAAELAEANRATAERQLELTRAGAWEFDVRNQKAQVQSLQQQAESARQTLARFTLRAPIDGNVLAINVGLGAYVTPQGTYGTYTQSSNTPIVVFGATHRVLNVRCYVDEILIPRIPAPGKIHAQMFVRGTRQAIALDFVRLEPYVSPKISLSDQRQERVDVRVLPIVFSFHPDAAHPVYPGQLVDVYVGG